MHMARDRDFEFFVRDETDTLHYRDRDNEAEALCLHY
jgi:hypothetical protein